MTYKDIPTGLHNFILDFWIPYTLTGPWQVKWDPPLASGPTATAEPGACLTLDAWKNLSSRQEALPAGMSGKIVTTVNEGGMLPAIYVRNADGTTILKIDSGSSPSLSTDGNQLAFNAGNGINIVNLTSGKRYALGQDGYSIHWSPDDTRLLFTTTFDLYLIHVDGTELQKLDTGSAQILSSVGWLADNQTIVYAAMGGAGFTFTIYNLQSGETKELFTFQNKAGYGALSPDGQWIVFADRVFGAENWGIFISRLDGSDRGLVASPDIPSGFTSVWGPDGQWLLLNGMNPDDTQTPVLVDPFTCQVAPIRRINGMVEGWSP
jgi:Tol biopolymer transport system component